MAWLAHSQHSQYSQHSQHSHYSQCSQHSHYSQCSQHSHYSLIILQEIMNKATTTNKLNKALPRHPRRGGAAPFAFKRPFAFSICLIASLPFFGNGFRLDRLSDTLHVLRLGQSEWRLPYPVYRFDTGDVDGDGSTDAIVGVVKATRHDPVVRRRVFIFKNYRGHVRPLWLGSRLGQPVVDFRFVAGEGVLRAVERERSGRYLVADYRWRAFGMDFVRYLGRELTEQQARKTLIKVKR